MKASELVTKYGDRLIGCTVTTEAIGDWHGGDSIVTVLAPDPAAPEIVYEVRRVSDDAEMGVFGHELATVLRVPHEA